MEHQEADMWQAAGRGTAGDDTARFLHELRQLRDGAGLGPAELAARAHYPFDTIKAAEAGPSLPDLPVLSAYVRGCGGTPEEWEERWRRLTSTPSLPVPASRHAGNSAAATAGARIGAVTQVVDAPDPSVIIAALGRVAEGMAVGDPDMEAASLTVAPRPAYPADDSPTVSSPAVVSPGDVSLADVSLPDVSPADVSAADVSPADVLPGDVALPDVSLPDVSLADAFAGGPADSPGVGSTADSLSGPAEPEADDRPQGWDPIRVSAAWPTIGSEDPRATRISDDTSASTSSADGPPADAPSARATSAGAAAGPGSDAPEESAIPPAIRQSAWARGVDAFGEPTGVARPGSRARTLMVAVVLVCVLAVVLAIFA